MITLLQTEINGKQQNKLYQKIIVFISRATIKNSESEIFRWKRSIDHIHTFNSK